jgi:hypothetical protein
MDGQAEQLKVVKSRHKLTVGEHQTLRSELSWEQYFLFQKDSLPSDHVCGPASFEPFLCPPRLFRAWDHGLGDELVQGSWCGEIWFSFTDSIDDFARRCVESSAAPWRSSAPRPWMAV